MSYSFGKNYKITVFGQSHSKEIGVVIDGIPAGYKINYNLIDRNLGRRRPGKNTYSTPRNELDLYEIISGEVNGITCGAPLTAVIKNKDHQSKDYSVFKEHPRPSHSDYPAYVKYNGYNDIRGGGQFSGRMTGPIVLAGSIGEDLLNKKNIVITSRIKSLGKIEDRKIDYTEDLSEELLDLKNSDFPVLDSDKKEQMMDKIHSLKAQGDSIGGVVEILVYGMEPGIGEPIFDSLESVIAHGIFSIPGVRGIEFGTGFQATEMSGSEHNDPYYYKDGEIKTKTNHHGGIIGGLSTSMPLVFRVAIKPTSSIPRTQETISLVEEENRHITIKGRHDPTFVHRALVGLEAITAISILDTMLEGVK